jgi:peroxiredoxin
MVKNKTPIELKLGIRAPAIDLPRIDGNTVQLDHYLGRTVIVTFVRHLG